MFKKNNFSAILVLLTIHLITSGLAFAEKATISDVSTDQDTTITIKKGDKAESNKKCEPIYQIVESTGTINGEAALMNKEAKANWKKACLEWKKETKELNKGNSLLSIDCGSLTCKTEGVEGYSCTSAGVYKIKTSLSN